MENKRYLDKVVGSLVRGTKINYDEEEIEYPFTLPPDLSFLTLSFSHYLSPSFSSSFIPHIFSIYCVNKFGLIDDEIKYVWEEYRNIIKGKIEDGE